MKITIIKYNAGNTLSVVNALKRLKIVPLISDKPEEIRDADKVIFPGVGEASSAMRYLRERGLDRLICSLKQPVLGICLGQQLMCRHSEEADTTCLGIFPDLVKRFRTELKVPHIGWNSIKPGPSPLFRGLSGEPYVYFVHSYYAEQSDYAAAITEYGESFSSALEKDNFFAVQFHPEKSGLVGETILKNFISL